MMTTNNEIKIIFGLGDWHICQSKRRKIQLSPAHCKSSPEFQGVKAGELFVKAVFEEEISFCETQSRGIMSDFRRKTGFRWQRKDCFQAFSSKEIRRRALKVQWQQ
jgi:hypothetical protein